MYKTKNIYYLKIIKGFAFLVSKSNMQTFKFENLLGY